MMMGRSKSSGKTSTIRVGVDIPSPTPGTSVPESPLGGAFFDPLETLNVFVVRLPHGTTDPGSGRLLLLSKLGNGAWDGPWQIAPTWTPEFSLGSSIAAAYYPPHGTLEAVVPSNDGAVWVFWMSETQPWRIQQIAGKTFTRSGQPLASAYFPDHDTLEVLLIDSHGAVNVLWKSSTQGWREAPITDKSFAADYSHIATAHYEGHGQLEAFIVDAQGRVVVLWKTGSAPWKWHPLTNPRFAPAGAPIAAALYASHDQLEVFVVGNDGALSVLWKKNNGAWSGPLRLTELGTLAAGAPVAATHFPPTDQLEAIVGDRMYLAREVTKYGNGVWRPCALALAPRSGVAVVPEAQTSRLMQISGNDEFRRQGVPGVDLGANTTHRGTHFVFFGDVPRGDRDYGPSYDSDAVAYASFMDQGAIHLKLITGGDGLFVPLRVKFVGGPLGGPGKERVIELGRGQTPTGSFSYKEWAYVFILVEETPGQEWPSPTSYLVRTRDPFDGQPYEQVFRFSDGRFWQVAPWVVPDLPELPRHAGRGVVMLGQGSYNDGNDAVYLAWMPLTVSVSPQLCWGTRRV